MTRWTTIACAILFGLAGRADAQPHATGYLFTAQPSNPIAVGWLSPGGAVSTMISAAQVNGAFALKTAVMDFDNRGIIAIYEDTTQTGLLRLDASNTATKFPTGVRTFGPRPLDLRVNEAGNYDLIISDVFGTPRMVEMDRSGSIRTLFLLSNVTPHSFTRDVHTGDYILHDGGQLLSQGRLFRISAGGAISTIAPAVGYSLNLESHCDIDPISGDVYFSTTGGILRVTQTGQTSLVAGGTPYAQTGPLFFDRASAPGGRFVAGAIRNSAGTVYVHDVVGGATRTIYSGAGLFAGKSLFPFLGRNVTTVERGGGLWEVSLRFPNHAGKPYVAPLTLSGTRPGFKIGTRHVAFNVDALTLAVAQNALAPIYRGATGQLDASGFGTAFLDVSSVPSAAGLKVQVIALVLDPAAPNGIALIADPRLIVL